MSNDIRHLVPRLRKPARITGRQLVFHDAGPQDAAFILGLRTDPKKSRCLSVTANDLSRQIAWMERYEADSSQVYFIIADVDGRRVGTVRMYDQQGTSFCWGSWIITDEVPSSYAIESALIIYHYALLLGFQSAHFDVRKDNVSVWTFHERFGAVRAGETDLDFLFTISHDAIQRSLRRYAKYLPDGIKVEFPPGAANAS